MRYRPSGFRTARFVSRSVADARFAAAAGPAATSRLATGTKFIGNISPRSSRAHGAKEVRRSFGYTESWYEPPRLPAGSSGGQEPLRVPDPVPAPGVGGGCTANVEL